jgi:hypothetical protein
MSNKAKFDVCTLIFPIRSKQGNFVPNLKQQCKFLLFWPKKPVHQKHLAATTQAGNTKGGSITVLLTSCLTGLESAV